MKTYFFAIKRLHAISGLLFKDRGMLEVNSKIWGLLILLNGRLRNPSPFKHVLIISVSCKTIKLLSISSNLSSDDVIRSAPDVTRNSNWPTWKSFYSFPGRLLENPAVPVEEEKEPQEKEADVGVGDILAQADGYWLLRRWSRCSSRKHRYCYISLSQYITHRSFFTIFLIQQSICSSLLETIIYKIGNLPSTFHEGGDS